MRGAIYLFCIFLVVLAGAWSNWVTLRTKTGLSEAAKLQRQIGAEREAIAVLRAEWAYLNAPERLERLVTEHAARLQLRPMTPERFALLGDIDAPAPDDGMEPVAIIDLDDLTPRLGAAPAPFPRPVGLNR